MNRKKREKNEREQKEREKKLEKQYNRLWACRDFELSHLWQRSIFLTAFLVLIFTGYGAIWLNAVKSNFEDDYIILHIISICISMQGVIFSTLWILMAKGSKYWYEVYEQEITRLENYDEYNDYECQGGFVSKEKTDARLFLNKKGFKYSVSGINIIIGQIMWILWFLIILVHVFFIMNIKLNNASISQLPEWICPIVILLMPFIVTIIIRSFVSKK